MEELTPKQKRTLEKLSKFAESNELATIDSFIELEEKVDSIAQTVDEKLEALSEELKKKLEGELVLEIDKEELKGDKGEQGEPGKPGKNYILTNLDKKEIARSIPVPVVEKVIEKTEVIRETPIITEVIKEIALDEKPEDIIAKIESIQEEDKKLSSEAIRGIKSYDAEIATLQNRTQLLNQMISSRSTGGGSQNLQQVTDIGNTTTNTIEVAGLDVGTSTHTPVAGEAYFEDTDIVLVGGSVTTNEIVNTPVVKATTSAGILIESNNGTDVALFGAGGGGNATFYDGVKLNAQTASRILSTDATSNIVALNTTTYPSLTELSYVKGVTSAIQTQLNAKADTSALSGYVPYTGATADLDLDTRDMWANGGHFNYVILPSGVVDLPNVQFGTNETGISGDTDHIWFSITENTFLTIEENLVTVDGSLLASGTGTFGSNYHANIGDDVYEVAGFFENVFEGSNVYLAKFGAVFEANWTYSGTYSVLMGNGYGVYVQAPYTSAYLGDNNGAGYFIDASSNAVALCNGTYAIQVQGVSVFGIQVLVNTVSPYYSSNALEVSGSGGFYANGTSFYAQFADVTNSIVADFYDGTNQVKICTSAGAIVVNGSAGYTGDLNDSTSTKIADVVGGIITAVYF